MIAAITITPAPRMLATTAIAEKRAELQPLYRIGSSFFMMLFVVDGGVVAYVKQKFQMLLESLDAAWVKVETV